MVFIFRWRSTKCYKTKKKKVIPKLVEKFEFYPLEKYPPKIIKTTPIPESINFVVNDSMANQGPISNTTPARTIIALPDIRLLLLGIKLKCFVGI